MTAHALSGNALRPPPGIRISGFNLLPHRQRAARGLRRRRAIECLLSALAGVFAATVWAGWSMFQQARLADERRTLEAELAQLAAPVAEYKRLDEAQAKAREHAALGARLAQPRARLLDVVESLSREPVVGVALHELKQTDDGIELKAGVAGSEASAAWIEQLKRVRNVKEVEMSDLRRVADSAWHALDVVVRLRWDVASPAPSPVRRTAFSDRRDRPGSKP
jgi:type IV pilus assembly protein PilN